MMTLSFITMCISGILILIALIKYIKYPKKLEGTQEISLLLFFASSIAFHGLLHMGAEIFYDFNPLKGKYIFTKLTKLTN
jgi:hypothetical protein